MASTTHVLVIGAATSDVKGRAKKPLHLGTSVPGEITVSIGKPIAAEGRTADEVGSLVESWIETEMRRLAPHRYSGPYDGANRIHTRTRDSSAKAI